MPQTVPVQRGPRRRVEPDTGRTTAGGRPWGCWCCRCTWHWEHRRWRCRPSAAGWRCRSGPPRGSSPRGRRPPRSRCRSRACPASCRCHGPRPARSTPPVRTHRQPDPAPRCLIRHNLTEEGSHGRQAVRGQRHRSRDRGSARTVAPDAVARARAGGRLVTGGAADLRAGTVPQLGRRLRLRFRRAAERFPAVPRHRRRAGHPLPARPLAGAGRVPAGAHARVAGFGARIPGDPRPADRPTRARRRSGGRVPRGRAVPARLRLERQAVDDRVGRHAHRARLGHLDGLPGLRAIRRAGR